MRRIFPLLAAILLLCGCSGQGGMAQYDRETAETHHTEAVDCTDPDCTDSTHDHSGVHHTETVDCTDPDCTDSTHDHSEVHCENIPDCTNATHKHAETHHSQGHH